jgi:hypothetical protein
MVLRTWLPRIVLLGILAIVFLLAWNAFDSWKRSLAPAPLSDRLSASFGVPVQVEESQLSLSPPRLILSKVTINHDVVLNDVSVRLTSRHVAQIFQSSQFRWGELLVGHTSVGMSQGRDLLPFVSRLNRALPGGIASLRFEDFQITDQDMLKGSWKVSLDRLAGGDFSKVLARQSSGNGWVTFHLTPETPEAFSFEMLASNWTLPFGLKIPSESISATGKVTLDGLDVGQFSVSGAWGEMHGSVAGTADLGWKLSTDIQSDGVDLDSLLRLMATRSTTDAEGNNLFVPMAQGIASFAGKIDGRGASFQDAVDASVMVAPVRVRSAILNGINLGFIAMNPGSNAEAAGGGSTRFASLEAMFVADGKQASIRELKARAGALTALGEINISEKHELSGLIHVDLGTTRVLAPIRVHVRGTLDAPKFGS